MASHKKPVCWSIAGSDSGGGAGIQADLATFHDFGVHGCTAVTAVTAQNSFAVGHVAVTSRRAMAAQINALDSDMPADAIKVGMLASQEVLEMVSKYLGGYRGFVVLDPVLKTSTGGSLLSDDAFELLRDELLPCADLLTPNRAEAEALLDRSVDTPEDIVAAAADLRAMGPKSVLITGGHFDAVAGLRLDYFQSDSEALWLAGENIDTVHSHGSGCTLSSGIAAAMAKGYRLTDALVVAKAYVTQGLRYSFQIGGGPGPVAHMGWPSALEDFPRIFQRFPDALPPAFPDCGAALGLYPVVDSCDWLERLLPMGVKTVQLRIKGQPANQVKTQIADAVALARQYDARLFVNDYWEQAIEAGAYGVHLGQEDLEQADLSAIHAAGLRLGISTHSDAEIARAHGVQPSYIALGPIYPTTSKVMDFAPQGLQQLQRWVQLLGGRYALTAIGGIDEDRAREVLDTGVGSCAMISAITESDNVEATVRRLLDMHQAG